MKHPLFDFNNAHVLVTGGTSGIGLTTALSFKNAGAIVTVTGRRSRASDYQIDISDFRYIPMDLEDKESIDCMIKSLDCLDILVNNAGMSLAMSGEDEWDPEIFNRSTSAMLNAVYRITYRSLKLLENSQIEGGASITSIASMSSYFGFPFMPAYGAAKTGLVGLTRALAVDLGRRHIRANSVAAGLVRSGMTAGVFANKNWTNSMTERTPVGRLGKPQDIADAILFLSSPAASWITGQTLAVDGGYSICG